MKKIIITRNIMQAIGGRDTIFGRGTIRTYTARTCEEILDIHGVQKADVIITEATLPLLGGAKLCSSIRNDAGLKNVSIIVVCDGTEASQAECREAQANAVLAEPVDPVQFYSKLSELLMIAQRQHLRTLLRVSAMGREKKIPFAGMSHNISISGLLLETDHELNKGDLLTLTVNIGPREISTDGLVMRTKKQKPGKFLYGIKFVNLDTKSLVIIDQFVKGAITH